MYGSGRKLIQFYTQPRIDKKFESITFQKAKSRTVITVVLLSTLMNRYIVTWIHLIVETYTWVAERVF